MTQGKRSGDGRGAPSEGGVGGRRLVWRLLPAETAVYRWGRRSLGVGIGCTAVGLPGLVRVVAGGEADGVRTTLLAIGYSGLALAAAVPVGYWLLVLVVGIATMLARRVRRGWTRVRTVRTEEVAEPSGGLRL